MNQENNSATLEKDRLKVVLCWHMHQPEYRNLETDSYQLPWTYLHAIKDYTDMAAHIENNPMAKAVVNFTPTLLEQLDDYSEQLHHYFLGEDALKDPLLAALAAKKFDLKRHEKLKLMSDCLRANKERLIDPYPNYSRLVDMTNWYLEHDDLLAYIKDQFLFDLVVWHHLAWMGETIRQKDRRIKNLLKKGSQFSYKDRQLLLSVIKELISGIIPRYKVLSDNGQVELSVTPYAHPIMPLMLDLNSAKDAMPEAMLPEYDFYPGGEERVHWHIEKGLDVFEKHFGCKPTGCWPSEGSLSDHTLRLLEQHGFAWTATGGNVLHNTLNRAGIFHDIQESKGMHHAYQQNDDGIKIFFRDDGLADLIGFNYSKWHADDAVANFIENLENIYHQYEDQSDRVVSVILDGENAWEYYPQNGFFFLSTLYDKIIEHPNLELTTFGEVLDKQVVPEPLPELVAGSWVYGTFSTWIADAAKNRGWDMLIEAKQCYDMVLEKQDLGPERLAKIEQQLAICEGSDWFWWFGDYNSADSVASFEKLYRLNLSVLYQLLDQPEPEYLSQQFTFGGGDPEGGGTMRPGQA